MKITVAEALAKLPLPKTNKWSHGVWDAQMLAHGTMSVSIFAPKVRDFQSPHDQDELYIIVTGSGEFVSDGTQYDFAPGDVFFVAAGVEHRFTRFSDDFVTWVVFFGSPGGEVPAAKTEYTERKFL
jgi:mannose-6-phosphate isomerase-like protein (cupin superfamily)